MEKFINDMKEIYYSLCRVLFVLCVCFIYFKDGKDWYWRSGEAYST